MNKFEYLLRSIANFSTNKNCPYCGCEKSVCIDRKFLVTTLNECVNCNLYFRHPKDTIEFNQKFYQKNYEQKDNITTDLPDDNNLKKLIESNFKGTAKDYTDKIQFIKRIIDKEQPKVIDFGANWGYTSYQFKNDNWQVQSYEISQERALFGSKIGININTSLSQLVEGVDVFFNAHVIEHLPDIKNMFTLAQNLLNKDGLIVIYCPNGSDSFKKRKPMDFHRLWGQVHPNYLNDKFFKNVFKDVPFLIGSNSLDLQTINWDKKSQVVLDLSGDELFAIASIKLQNF